MGFLAELRRRRLFRVAALYVVGAWMVLQVFDLLFPRLGISDAVMGLAFVGALMGFPVALAFGWIYDITPQGIVRTRPSRGDENVSDYSLKRLDYLILAGLMLVVGAIVFKLAREVSELPPEGEASLLVIEAPEHSIAVLPFENMSNDPDNEYFCDGISEEILNKLAAISELHVIARTSSFSLKNSGFDARRIAAILGVRYLLQGSVRRDGSQLRISTQLLDSSGKQLWNTSFDRELESIFAIQRDIANSVAKTIKPQIIPVRDSGHTPLIEAYEYYLAGHEMYMKRLPAYQWNAAEQFQKAIELDAAFAAPYAELATMQTLVAQWETGTREIYIRAQENIDQALALNPNLATAYAAQGLLLNMQEPTDLARAEEMLRTALDLDPNLVNARNWLMGILRDQGLIDEAIEQAELALRSDPLAPVINVNLAMQEMDEGRFEQAEHRLLRLLQVPVPSNLAYSGLRNLYRLTGRLDEFNEIAKQTALAFARQEGRPWVWPLARSYAYLGLWQRAAGLYHYLETEYTGNYQIRLVSGNFRRRQGRFEEALTHFKDVLESEGLNLADLNRSLHLELGVLYSMTGAYPLSINSLEESLTFDRSGEGSLGHDEAQDAYQALAWAHMNLGNKTRASEIIGILEDNFLRMESEGHLHKSDWLFSFAQNALLAGDTDLALERLQTAMDAGWRDYFMILRDPRWDSVRGHLHFRQIMTWLKSDIDVQRARVEHIDATENFQQQVDAAVAQYQAGARN